MTIRRANLGGTNWSNGEVLYAVTDLNDTFGASLVRASASTEDAVEYSVASTTTAFSDMGFTKTFTVPDVGAKNMLVGFKIVFDRKVSFADATKMRGKLVNNTTGETSYLYDDVDTATANFSTLGGKIINTTYAEKTMYVEALQLDVASTVYNPGSLGTHIAGTTYTITFEAGKFVAGTSRTTYIQDITLTAYWTAVEDAVTEGWA